MLVFDSYALIDDTKTFLQYRWGKDEGLFYKFAIFYHSNESYGQLFH